MYNLKKFSTTQEYENYMNGSGGRIYLPNVVLCEDDRKDIKYNTKHRLIYWWDSEDDLVNGYWVDRVNGKKWQAHNVTKVGGMYYVKNERRFESYFDLDLNDATNGLILPYRWKIEVECVINTIGIQQDNVYAFYVVDLGSLTSSNHAFSIHLIENTTDNNISLYSNYKAFGNNNSTQYRFPTITGISLNEMTTLTMGDEAYDDNNDILFGMVNKGNKVYGQNPHPHTQFNGNWHQKMAYIGTGITPAYSNGSGYIKSIKIFYD